MGLIYTYKDFDCIDYLRNVAANKLRKRFGLSLSMSLDTLAKSLLYTDYEDLINDINSIEDKYDSRNGCFFSEFVLAEELEIEIHEAYSLKKELDNHHYYGSGGSHGNIEVANLSNVRTYSYNISRGNETRLMFDYPFEFYTRIYDQSFLIKPDEAYSIEALWCDGFSFLHPSYFLTRENKKLYIESILESLLSYNHLVVSYRHFDSWIEHDPLTYGFIRSNFENYLIYDGSIKNRPYGIYFPQKGKSLRRRLGFKSSLLVKESTVEENCNIESIDKREAFKNAREEKGMTKLKLAELSGISVRTIYNVENESHSHNSHTIAKLASVLKIDINLIQL